MHDSAPSRFGCTDLDAKFVGESFWMQELDAKMDAQNSASPFRGCKNGCKKLGESFWMQMLDAKTDAQNSASIFFGCKNGCTKFGESFWMHRGVYPQPRYRVLTEHVH